MKTLAAVIAATLAISLACAETASAQSVSTTTSTTDAWGNKQSVTKSRNSDGSESISKFNKDAFGLPVPLIYVSQDRAMHRLLEDWHKYMAYALLALLVVHVVAALRHHFVKRNTVLRRMWFGDAT